MTPLGQIALSLVTLALSLFALFKAGRALRAARDLNEETKAFFTKGPRA